MTATTLPAGFRRIHLELAREHDHPAGDGAVGYEFVAPLAADGHIDTGAWRSHRDACRVVRRRAGEEHRIGRLVRRPGGSWAFRYSDMSDETAQHLEAAKLIAGDYVSLREEGAQHTFKVVSIGPI